MVRANLSQIELRIAAELAQERRTIEAFCWGTIFTASPLDCC